MSRVASQIVVAMRRASMVMAVVLAETRNNFAAQSGSNPNGPWAVARLAALGPLAVSGYLLRVSAWPVKQQPDGAVMIGNKRYPYTMGAKCINE